MADSVRGAPGAELGRGHARLKTDTLEKSDEEDRPNGHISRSLASCSFHGRRPACRGELVSIRQAIDPSDRLIVSVL